MQDKQLPSSVVRVGNNLYRWQQPGPGSMGSQAADAAAPADSDSAAEQPLASSLELADLRKSPTGTSPAVTVGVPASPLRSLASLTWLRDRGAAEVCVHVAFSSIKVDSAVLYSLLGLSRQQCCSCSALCLDRAGNVSGLPSQHPLCVQTALQG